MTKQKSTNAARARDPDDAPAWTEAVFDIAEMRDGDRVLKPAVGYLQRGRPRLEDPKQRVTLRLDADVVRKLREHGRGWQTQANALLRKAVGV